MNIYDALKLCAGLVFFLFGMGTMSDGLEKTAGGKLEVILKKMTANPIISVLLGALITAVLQSSSATTVMLVGLVNSGLMKFEGTVCVLFGANIGTTVTSWLLSLSGVEASSFFVRMLKPENFSPILAVVGIFFIMSSKSDKRKSLGSIFVGFTVLIYGMSIMTSSVSGLADSPEFGKLLLKFNNPVLGLVMGIAVTAVIQSSSASIGILQALSLTGSITYTIAIPIILGQNIGTCVTGLVSCIGAGAKAKRVAVSQLLINVIGAVVFLPVFIIVAKLFKLPLANEAVNPASIAAVHTVFNVITVLALLPIYKKVALLAEKLVREKSNDEIKKSQQSVYLDERLLRTPAVVVAECDNYGFQMVKDACSGVLNGLALIFEYDFEKSKELSEKEKALDKYEDALSNFLVKLSAQSVSNEESGKIAKILHTIGDFERLGDHALNLCDTACEIHDKKLAFSSDAEKELKILFGAVSEIIKKTTDAYLNNDTTQAVEIEPLEEVIDGLVLKMKSNHIERLQNGACTIQSGFVLSDILTNCERISDHCSNIAVAVMECFEPHRYLKSVKYGNKEFNKAYEQYKSKYKLR